MNCKGYLFCFAFEIDWKSYDQVKIQISPWHWDEILHFCQSWRKSENKETLCQDLIISLDKCSDFVSDYDGKFEFAVTAIWIEFRNNEREKMVMNYELYYQYQWWSGSGIIRPIWLVLL